MTTDAYKDFAERYDWMKPDNPDRDEFFRELFEKHNVNSVLDCAFGTGHEHLIHLVYLKALWVLCWKPEPQ